MRSDACPVPEGYADALALLREALKYGPPGGGVNYNSPKVAKFLVRVSSDLLNGVTTWALSAAWLR